MKFSNVIQDSGKPIDLSDTKGTKYIHDILINLKETLSNFDEYLFILYGTNSGEPPISQMFVHPKKILIYEGGENLLHDFDELSKHYLLIFTHYNISDIPNVINIPLGHFSPITEPYIPFNKRLYDISFIGCLNSNRIQLASKLTGINEWIISFGLVLFKKLTLKFLSLLASARQRKSYIKFNPDFNKGISNDWYIKILKHSKIVLVPRGWINSETFRLYESMFYGCIVICEELPDREYYNDINVIQVKDWKEGVQVARQLLTSPNLQTKSDSIKNDYETYMSSASVSDFMLKIIEETFGN